MNDIITECKDIAARLNELASHIDHLATRTNIKRSADSINEALTRYAMHKKRPPETPIPHPNPLCIEHGQPLTSCLQCNPPEADS